MKKGTIFGYHVWVFGFVWILLFAAGQSKLFRDPGTFSHTAIGEQILTGGNIPWQDSFSFTKFGEHWIAQQWLGECVMAAVHRIAGFDGLLVVAATLIAMLYSSLALRVERSGMDRVMGSLILALSLASASHHLHIRPHLITIVFMAFVYSRLCDVDMGRKSVHSLFGLIPVFIVWANTHGGILGGLGTLLIVATGWILARHLEWRSPFSKSKALGSLLAVVLLSSAVPLTNPYGLDMPATWLDIMGSSAISQMIQEHASILALLQHGGTEAHMSLLILLCLGLFYIAVLAGTDREDRAVTWYIPIVWFLLSLSRIRHAPLFAVIAVVAIVEMFPFCRWVHRLGNRGLVTFRLRDVSRGEKRITAVTYWLALAVTCAVLIAFQGSAQLPSTQQNWVKLDGSHWPVEVLPELKAVEARRPRGTPIFHDMLAGGFLIYHTPRLRVFIDDRCELYGDDFILKYVRAARSDFEAWEKTYGFDLALLLPTSQYRAYIEGNRDWHVVKRSPSWILYEKRRE